MYQCDVVGIVVVHGIHDNEEVPLHVGWFLGALVIPHFAVYGHRAGEDGMGLKVLHGNMAALHVLHCPLTAIRNSFL